MKVGKLAYSESMILTRYSKFNGYCSYAVLILIY